MNWLSILFASPLSRYIQRKARLENKKLQRGNDRESQGLPLSLSLMAFFLCLSLKSSSTTFETEYSAFLIPNFEMEVAEMISDMSFTFRLHLKHISREVAILAQRRVLWMRSDQVKIIWKSFSRMWKQVSQNSNDNQEPQRFLKYVVLDDSVTSVFVGLYTVIKHSGVKCGLCWQDWKHNPGYSVGIVLGGLTSRNFICVEV